MTGNRAIGGAGGSGANGGDGWGGGLFVGTGGSAALTDVLIYLNSALAGAAGSGGSDGLGQGGGIYVASGGTVTLKKSKVTGNLGPGGIDNIYGTVIHL